MDDLIHAELEALIELFQEEIGVKPVSIRQLLLFAARYGLLSQTRIREIYNIYYGGQ